MKPEMVGDSWAATRLRISSSCRSGKVIVILVVAIPFTIPQRRQAFDMTVEISAALQTSA